MLNEFAPERVTFFDANFEFYYGETHYSSDLFQQNLNHNTLIVITSLKQIPLNTLTNDLTTCTSLGLGSG